MASPREGHPAVLLVGLWGSLPHQALSSSCREAWPPSGECMTSPGCDLKWVVQCLLLLLQRLELDQAELVEGLTVDQAQAALRDLPQGLKESFW